MISQEQIKGLQERVETLRKCVDIDAKRAEVEEKEKRSQEPDFWNDPKEAEAFLKGMSGVKSWVTAFDEAGSAVDDLEVLLELEPDSPETDSAYARAVSLVEKLELRNMLGGEGDSLGAVLTINSGAGGTEANDWSAMLMRMYMRWGERNGYKMTVTELIDGDEAGIKSATVQFEGDYAYGYLKAESGVHRLVRISPFNAQGKRQTTFSSVFVYPLVDDTINIEINPSDIEWDTFRSPERQQGGDRSARAPHPHGHHGREHRDPQPAGQPPERAAHPQVEALRHRAQEAPGEAGGARRPEEKDRMGLADTLLCAPSLQDGEGPAHRL